MEVEKWWGEGRDEEEEEWKAWGGREWMDKEVRWRVEEEEVKKGLEEKEHLRTARPEKSPGTKHDESGLR